MVVDIGNALSTFSQLALGLAGFASILIALSGKPSSWTRVDSYRIRHMLTASFLAVFLSLLPPMLAFLATPEPMMWRISLAVLAAATMAEVLFALVGFRRLTRLDRGVLRHALVFAVCALLSAAALWETAAVWRNETMMPGVFFAGLVILLAFAVYLVVRFLFARPTD